MATGNTLCGKLSNTLKHGGAESFHRGDMSVQAGARGNKDTQEYVLPVGGDAARMTRVPANCADRSPGFRQSALPHGDKQRSIARGG